MPGSGNTSTHKRQRRLWWWVKQQDFGGNHGYRPMYPEISKNQPRRFWMHSTQDWGNRPILGSTRKKAAMNYHHMLELNNTVSNKRVQQLYLEDQPQEVIDQAEWQAGSARWTLESIQRVDEAGLSRHSPKHPRTPRGAGRHKYYAKDNMQVSYGEMQEWMTQPVQAIVPDTERYWSPEAETASVYPLKDHDYHDPIMRMLHSALEESRDDDPDDSIVAWMRLNISPPEEYSGNSDLKVYEMFVTGILWWLKLHGLLGVKYTETQVQFLGMQLKGNASEWFMRNVECPDRPIRDWSLESVIKGLQKWFLNLLTHRQASNKFNTIKQGQKTVQELIQELTKYAAWMVQYPDDYLFRRRLIATLRPSLQKEVLHRGITAEFSSMQDILEKAKDIEDSLHYDIGSWMAVEIARMLTRAWQNHTNGWLE